MLIFQILGNADYVFTSIFTLEIILKVMHPEQCTVHLFPCLSLLWLSLFFLLFPSLSLFDSHACSWKNLCPPLCAMHFTQVQKP